MNTLEIRSSVRGYATMIFWAGIWIMILLALSKWAVGWIPTLDYKMERDFLTRVTWVMDTAAVIIAASTMVATLYGVFSVNSFHKNKEGNWHKVSEVGYGFPFSKNTEEVAFDRIVRVDVNQPSISRLFGAGDLILTLVTYTNADAVVTQWKITAIENPHQRQAEIMSGSPKHDGLNVRLSGRCAGA